MSSVDVYRSMFENAIEGIYQTTPEGRYLLVNPALAHMYGYASPQELIRSLTHIEDQLYVDPFRRRIFVDIMEAVGLVQDFESEVYRKDGSTIWIAETGRAVRNQAGEIIYYEGMVEDITERRLALDRIAEQAAIIDIAPAAILICDLSSRLTSWNKEAEKIYGWSRKEVLGRPIPELLFPDENPSKYHEIMQHILQHGEWEGEVTQKTKTGKTLQLESKRILMRELDGTPKAILSINTNITERKKIEAQVLRNQRLESIGTLAGGIAHDLNNVLTPISMSVGLLRYTSNEDSRNRILDSLETNINRGASIVRQVLSFARGAGGQKGVTHLKSLFSEIDQIIHETFPKNIQVHLSLPEYLWVVRADTNQLHQVLLNLCLNSRDAMPQGGHLTITAENRHLDGPDAGANQAQVGPYVVLCVGDTGAGINQEYIDKIFDPFFTTKADGQGSGLGLPMALSIVKSHGGFLTVESSEGHGTTVKVHLPALTSARPSMTATSKLPLPRGRGETILVVDDESTILTVTTQALQSFGYQVRTASNGSQGLDVYTKHQHSIAAVLVDMVMPVMDGMAMTTAIRELNPQARVITMSGQMDEGIRDKVTATGSCAFLLKPCSIDTLIRTVHEVLRNAPSSKTT